ncbi:MAG TPA: amidase family protein [Polyangiales bacterium]
MFSFAEYAAHDGVALSQLVRTRQVSASELLEAAIARAEAKHPALNAVVIPMYDQARARAGGALTGPLAGVPFLIKDLFQDYAGVPATSGCRAWQRARYTPERHSEIVRRWLAAGSVIFGRTNTPEFGAKALTEPECWGPTHNPWERGRSPGGSSGGAAAAVAAGIVPAAGASDGGGSIRIPAASTGLFGLKPGRGRTPTGPEVGEALHGAAVNHVISRSVRDSAAWLDVSHGAEQGAIGRLEAPARPYLDEVAREPGKLRVAFSSESPLGTSVHPAARAGVEQTAKLLESLGHHVEPAQPAIDGLEQTRHFLRVWMAQLALQVKYTRQLLGAGNDGFELDSLAMEAIGSHSSAVEYAESYVMWLRFGAALSEFFTRYDVYLTPTLAEPPPAIGAVKTPAWAARLMRAGLPLGLGRLIAASRGTIEQVTLENMRGVPFTQLANVTGVPAMSVPLCSFEDGLPLGMHFMADHGGEGLLLSLAGQLERAAPWSQRRPPD